MSCYSSLVLLGLACLASSVLPVAPFLSGGQALYLSLVVVPLLSLSLMGVNIENDIMNISTGKNVVGVTDADTVRYVLLCHGARFLPSVALLVLAHLLKHCLAQSDGVPEVPGTVPPRSGH